MKFKPPILIAAIVALAFGAACAAFGLISPLIWNSPDETAVAFFSRVLVSDGRLPVFEPANLFGSGNVHPRSIISLDANLVPASFYGVMYYFAVLFKLLGRAGWAIGAPLATALASLAVFFGLRRALGDRTAQIGQILFWANPAVWYFTSRGLYPNIIFIDFVIVGLACLLLRPWNAFAAGRGHRLLELAIDDLVGLAFIGAAFIVRPVELIWLAPILAVLAWRARRRLKWYRIVWGAVILAAFVGTLLVFNGRLYGSPLNFGYTAGSTAPGISIPAASAPSSLPLAVTKPRPFILPFGFHPRLAVSNAFDYLILFAWWLPLAAAVGFLLTRNRVFRKQWGWALLWVAACIDIYYGSGVFIDSSVSQWTIGSSYLRYFLPASILLVPFAAEGLAIASSKRRWVAPTALALFVVLSGWTVYWRSPESLVPLAATLNRYAEIKSAVLKEVGPDAVIITERSDKIFFPDRRVIIGLRDKQTLDEIPRLANRLKIFYYGITIAESELPSINKELHARHFQLGRIKSFGNETLYGITVEK
jgi:hypothetical protein